jgi:DNA-binding FrmR family transcriptional regulator
MNSSMSEASAASAVPAAMAGSPEHGPSGVNLEAVRRLKNIAGQVNGIRRMVEDEKYCIDILTQVSAVRAALNSVGLVILKRHIEHCVTDAIESGGENKQQVIDELMAVFARGDI